MNFKTLISIFSLLISSITALSLPNFPLNLKVTAGSELPIEIAGDHIAAGSKVKVELWDNVNDSDVNVAILGDNLIIGDNNTLNLTIPSNLPKTHNAFIRVFYNDCNVVSPRFSIKHAKNCLSSKVIPTIVPTPIIIHTPTPTPNPIPTPIVIHNAGDQAQAGSGHGGAAVGTPSVTATRTAPVRTVSTISSSTSTSSASIAKFSAGSVAVAVIVAFSMLF